MKPPKEKIDHFTIEIGLKFILTAVNIKMIFVPVLDTTNYNNSKVNDAKC